MKNSIGIILTSQLVSKILDNGIGINVFGSNEKGEIYLLRRSKSETCENDIDLLFISNEKTNHYCWIKDLERLMVQKDN